MARTFLVCLAVLSRPDAARAQDPFGGQSRANAASQAIVLAVQQGISALPPTSAQSLVYEFDRGLDVPVRSERLGPISLRAPETVGKGVLSLRAAVSYFALDASLGPIDYRLTSDDPDLLGTQFAKLGTKIDTKVGVFAFTLNYGITRDIEVDLNLPIVLVDAYASQIYSADPSDGALGFRSTIPELNHDLQDPSSETPLVLKERSFSASGPGPTKLSFNDGTHLGVGRISLGTKALVYTHGPFRLGAECNLYLPSPSQDQFAGSDSTSILPRLIAAVRLQDWMRILFDVGYDYDFSVDELRRFVWSFGTSFPLAIGTFDLGVGGSKYNTPIVWTPSQARASSFPGDPPDISVVAVGDNQTGTNYVDFLAGAKIRLSDAVIVSGALNVPVTKPGLQSTVRGTLAVEVYF